MASSATKTFAVIVFLIAVIAIFDRTLRPGVSASVLYVVPIVLTLGLSGKPRPKRIALAAVTLSCALLSGLDYFLTPSHSDGLLYNELLAIVAQLTTASLVLMQMRSNERERDIYERVEKERLRLALVHSIATTTSSMLDLDDVLRAVAENVAALFQADTTAIWLADESGQQVRPAFYSPASYSAVAARYQKVQWASSPLAIAEAIRRRSSLIAGEDRDTSPETMEALRLIGAKTSLVVPLFVREQLIGAMTLAMSSERRFSDNDIALVETIGKQIAVAIENAGLFSSLNKKSEQLALINEIGQVFASTLDLQSIYLTIRERLAQIIDCDTLLISLFDPQTETIRCAFACSDGEIYSTDEFESLKLGAGPHSECILKAKPIIVANIQKEHPRSFRYVGHNDCNPVAIIYVPMIAEERAIGVIQAQSVREGAYTEEDVPLLAIIANQAASAIQNARLYADAVEGRQAMERANRIKDDFLATLSHEMRTPLTPIMGWARMFSQLPLDDREAREQAANVIERNARMLNQLVNDLLDMSRIESGKLSLLTEPIDVNSIIGAVCESLQSLAESRMIKIETRLPADCLIIEADPARLEQIINNLLINAIKFTEEGGRISISVEPSDSFAVITVTDSGIGISPDFLPYIFERFRQADSSMKRQHAGLGIGLSIVKSLVEMHSGEVSVHSNGIGCGATFKVRLPLTTCRPDANLK